MLAGRTVDMMRALFMCFALALLLNLFFVLQGSSEIASYGSALVKIGDFGTFRQKMNWESALPLLSCCHCMKFFSEAGGER